MQAQTASLSHGLGSAFDQIPQDRQEEIMSGANGGIVAFDETVNMAKMARYAFDFCAIESCGKCTPCRVGSTRGVEVMDHILAGKDVEKHTTLIRDLSDTMFNGSLCALGGMTPYPVLSALNHFPKDFGVDVKETKA